MQGRFGSGEDEKLNMTIETWHSEDLVGKNQKGAAADTKLSQAGDKGIEKPPVEDYSASAECPTNKVAARTAEKREEKVENGKA